MGRNGGVVHVGIYYARGSLKRGSARTGDDRRFRFDRPVVCAGLYSDTVAGPAGDDPTPASLPRRLPPQGRAGPPRARPHLLRIARFAGDGVLSHRLGTGGVKYGDQENPP